MCLTLPMWIISSLFRERLEYMLWWLKIRLLTSCGFLLCWRADLVFFHCFGFPIRSPEQNSSYLQDPLPNSACPALNKGLTVLKKRMSCSTPNKELHRYCLTLQPPSSQTELQVIAFFGASFTLILPLLLVRGPAFNFLVLSAMDCIVYF